MNQPYLPEHQAVQAGYSGDSMYRPRPRDLPSLMLNERIVYIGTALSDQVTELIVAQLLYLQYDDPEKPIYVYINSGGTAGFETEAFAISDTLRYIKPTVHTICIGMAAGASAMLLSAGTKGYRASLPNASIILHQPYGAFQGQASDIEIRANEVVQNRQTLIDILSRNTGQTKEKISKDLSRLSYMSAEDAKEYGVIDKVLESRKDLPKALPVSV